MGKGAFIKTENGWMIDTKVKINGEYKHFTKRGYSTLQSAKADFETAKENFIARNQAHHKDIYFNELFDEYENYRSYKICDSTLMVEIGQNKKYILNCFQDKPIKNVFTLDSIRKWYRNILINNEVKDNKKNKVFQSMKQLLKFAYSKKYIDATVYQDCDVEIECINENDTHKQKVIWSDEEESKFFKATETNEIDNLMFKVFFLCATRISEFLALQVRAFNHDKCTIAINQQVKQTIEGKTISKQLKSNNSYRVILITKELSDELQNYINLSNLNEDSFLWHNKTSANTPITSQTFRRKLFYYCEVANVQKIVPHGVRHNMAVKLAKQCENTQDIEICASRLGHTPSVFMNIYANHTTIDEQQKLMNKMFNK